MNIYTKSGDKGNTSLIRTKNISKSDDRIQLVGQIDELSSQIGVVKTMLTDPETAGFLEKIQRRLITLMAGVADPYNREYRIPEEATKLLEAEIDRIEGSFTRPKAFILPGGCPLSAQIDVARTVARRAERALALVSVRYGADDGSKSYMNRLADYLYVLARLEDARAAGPLPDQGGSAGAEAVSVPDPAARRTDASVPVLAAPGVSSIVREVLKDMGVTPRIQLAQAKRLMEKIEAEAFRRGLKAVIAICTPEGNPVAVQVMDGAFLVSFDIAVKKAYTSVAVRMSTMELSKLAQPGQTFYGVDKLDGGKIVIFGGGIPLKLGDTVIGGLGISGGTSEQDHGLALYGAEILTECL